jgi:RimJ/RimL family protein N-acetyltransferase
MKLTSNRLIYSEITEKHIEEIHRMNSLAEVARFNTIGIPESIEETASLLHNVIYNRFMKKRTLFGWSVRLKSDNAFVGELGMQLSAPKYNRAEIHYNLMPEHWGNGYATEIVKSVIDFGFNTLKLHRIEAGVAVDNIASIKVLEKVGMQREGRKRKILPLADGWSDNYGYAILREDFKDRKT